MDINKAKEIISALAEGIDPTTGEILAKDHVCNQGEVVRAFYVALNAMGTKQKNKRPENAGKPWSAEDESQLKELFESGASKKEISRLMKRSVGAVTSRLALMGLDNNRG